MTEKRLCEVCGEAIPKERIRILPDTTTCVKCSQTQPYSRAEAMSMGALAESDTPHSAGDVEYEFDDDN